MDVPSYYVTNTPEDNILRLKKIRQYKGYLANLNKYDNLENFICANFSSKSRSRIFKYQKKLEKCFNIKYSCFFGNNISKDDYDNIFQAFNDLLKKQSEEKKIVNEALATEKWCFLHELIYPMILEKKAAIIIIYSDDTPISISLSYVSNNIFSNSLMAFDSNYSKFHVGFIEILMRLKFCFKEKIDILDFSKGDHDYKKRWGDEVYDFEYHILYDSKSITSVIIAFFLIYKYQFIQYLRDRKINILFHSIIYFIKKPQKSDILPENHETKEINEVDDNLNFVEIDFRNTKYSFLKNSIYDFLFRFSESINDIKVFSTNNLNEPFIFIGKNHKVKVVLKNTKE
ncbi:GNAT family N-acetyltransferase [Confluentibacter lentus]|uniref:GNAT family N-acetyltransferase n=1 Tax=Confluentibacter lentus TaxID=1699412 RepID=UPI0012FD7F68|nr:GNAT family N-acetyltransferase [Confluentibacter lentus]